MSEQVAGSKKKASRLGRGLSSLMATPAAVPVEVPAAESGVPRGTSSGQAVVELGSTRAAEGFELIPVEEIRPNPQQPRQHFEVGRWSVWQNRSGVRD